MGTHSDWLIDEFTSTLASGDERPARWLDIVAEPLGPAGFLARVAQACFGDASSVYNVTDRLTTPGMHDVGSALIGVPPGHLALPGESLIGFIESRGRGVIAIDDLQAFPSLAVETLAQIADSGRVSDGASLRTIAVTRFVILACARLDLPSPRELMQKANQDRPWPAADRPPDAFRDTLEGIALERYPQHFDPWVVGRFERLDAGFAWERYCELVARDELDQALFAKPRALAVPAAPPQPLARNVLVDVAAIPELPDAGEPYDVFISYSWSRTEDGASWLRDELRRRGLRVFFDKDALSLDGLADDQIKTVLIQQLRAIVSRSRAWVVFAAALKSYAHDDTITDAEALTRGIAMEVFRSLVQWNWQTFEMRHMGQRLMIGDSAAYVVGADGQWDASFGKRHIEGQQDMLNFVLGYLGEMGVLPDPAV